jgi:hypothetical protein
MRGRSQLHSVSLSPFQQQQMALRTAHQGSSAARAGCVSRRWRMACGISPLLRQRTSRPWPTSRTHPL